MARSSLLILISPPLGMSSDAPVIIVPSGEAWTVRRLRWPSLVAAVLAVPGVAGQVEVDGFDRAGRVGGDLQLLDLVEVDLAAVELDRAVLAVEVEGAAAVGAGGHAAVEVIDVDAGRLAVGGDAV